MNKEKFDAIVDGDIFAEGVLPNSPEGLYMTDSNLGKMLRWVAVKGYGYDWCIYCHWADHSDTWIAQHGDKIGREEHIRKCVPCDDEVFNLYRY